MRILIVTSNRSLIGGVEKYLLAILPQLAANGHEIGLVYENGWDPRKGSIDSNTGGVAVWCLAEQSRGIILGEVEDWKPDIVYSQGVQDELLESAFQQKYPYILYAHNYYGTCATGQKCHMFPQPQPCERRLGPMCLVLHYPRRCGGLSPLTAWRNYRRQSVINAQLNNCRAILVASGHMQHEFLLNGVRPNQLFLVPLPMTDRTPHEFPSASSAQPGKLLLLARLTDIKGTGHLISAIPIAAERLSRRLTLTVAGDGPEQQRLMDLAVKLGVEAEFTGWINTEQKINLMMRSELLVVPSLWPEPFGLVGIEAGCLGLPAVGYEVGGIPDWLIPGHSGELAPGNPPTINGLVEAIIRALQDPTHYSALRYGAWKQAHQHTIERHLSELEAIFERATCTSSAGSLT